MMDNYSTCECGKISYHSRHEAGIQIRSLQRRQVKAVYSIYSCKLSGDLHITTASKKLRTPKKEGKYPIRIEDYATKPPEPIVKKKKKKR